MAWFVQQGKRWFLIVGQSVAGDEDENAATPGRCAPDRCPSLPQIGKTTRRVLDLSLLYKHPTLLAAAVFVALLSGPPKFRIRDPQASLRSDLDWVVVLHLVVWGLAGVWIAWQLAKRFQAGRPLLRLHLPQILGMAMIFLLGVSVFVSEAPALTAFKVYQMLVALLFTQIFVERFGVWTSLRQMLFGNALLCLGIAGCAIFCPDEVWTASEFNPDPSRLFGVLIAPTGVVAVLGLILLLTCARRIWKTAPLVLLVTFLVLIVLSLMRTAYVATIVFFALVLVKRPRLPSLRRFTYLVAVFLLLLYLFSSLPSVNHYRDPETVSNLGDRVGLWRHLTAVTLSRSPWLGLGYYAASRIHGPEYNPGLGTAHSMFIEVLAGGGVLSFGLLVGLCATLVGYAARLLYLRSDRIAFATSSLLVACLLFGCMGEEIDSGPVAIGFWYCAAVLPWLSKQSQNVAAVTAKTPRELAVGITHIPHPEVS